MINYNITLAATLSIMEKRGLTPKGAIHKLLDQEVERRCRPYVPRELGRLEGSGSASVPEVGSVKWTVPYSKYQYYGFVMIGKKPKTLTSKPLRSRGGGLRGSRWFERMKTDQCEQIVQTLTEAIGGGGR